MIKIGTRSDDDCFCTLSGIIRAKLSRASVPRESQCHQLLTINDTVIRLRAEIDPGVLRYLISSSRGLNQRLS